MLGQGKTTWKESPQAGPEPCHPTCGSAAGESVPTSRKQKTAKHVPRRSSPCLRRRTLKQQNGCKLLANGVGEKLYKP